MTGGERGWLYANSKELTRLGCRRQMSFQRTSINKRTCELESGGEVGSGNTEKNSCGMSLSREKEKAV